MPPIPCIFRKEYCEPDCHLYLENLAILNQIINIVTNDKNNGDKQDTMCAIKTVFKRENLEFNLDTLTKLLLNPESLFYSKGNAATELPADIQKAHVFLWNAREKLFETKIDPAKRPHLCSHGKDIPIIETSYENSLRIRT